MQSEFEPVFTQLYDKIGKYDAESHGSVMNHLVQITQQKNDERNFAAVIQCWLGQLLFGKERVDSNYLDLSTFNYFHYQNEYLDFMALQEGSIDRQDILALKEITLLVLLLLEFIRTGSQETFRPKKTSDRIENVNIYVM